MNDDRYGVVSAAFQEALELDGEARAGFLDALESSDPSIFEEVMSLLKADGEVEERPGAWAESRLGHGKALLQEIASGGGEEAELSQVGPYSVLATLGQGGMGTVYLCQQDVPLRKVALKVIKVGMDTPQVVRRFAVERDVLARLDHPGIARVLDAGSTEAGRPYFVMEACDGRPILEYCDRERLDLRQRLDLFLQVLHAVEHAHRRGVLHRDIKPSNLLVNDGDGKPQAKVIDFGLARAMDAGADGTLLTQAGQLLGTPAYMSPEQVSLDSSELDVRCDVYSLGVVLYELLTSKLPFEHGQDSSVQAALARLADGGSSPRRPAAALPKDKASGIDIAQQRRTTPDVLRKALLGELEWIALRALEPDRERRYPSALFFARDVEAYLEGRPVEAAPPGALYVLRKTVARHKALTTALAIAFLSLTVGLVTALIQRNQAIASEKETRQMLDEVHDYNDVMRHMLNSADPRMVGRSAQVTDMLERGLDYLWKRYSDNPRLMTEIQASIGSSYAGLGLWKAAGPLLADAVSQRRILDDGNFARMGHDLHDLGTFQAQAGQYAEAEASFREAIEWFDAIPEPLGIERKAGWQVSLASLLAFRHALNEAESLIDEALGVLLDAPRFPASSVARAYAVRGHLFACRGEAEQAAHWLDQAQQAILSRHDPDHVYATEIGVRRGRVLNLLGLGAQAAAVLEPAVAASRAAFGPEPSKCDALDALAEAYMIDGRLDEAAAVLDESQEALRRQLEPDSLRIAQTELLVGRLAFQRGHAAKARGILEPALLRVESVLGTSHPDSVRVRALLAK